MYDIVYEMLNTHLQTAIINYCIAMEMLDMAIDYNLTIPDLHAIVIDEK